MIFFISTLTSTGRFFVYFCHKTVICCLPWKSCNLICDSFSFGSKKLITEAICKAGLSVRASGQYRCGQYFVAIFGSKKMIIVAICKAFTTGKLPITPRAISEVVFQYLLPSLIYQRENVSNPRSIFNDNFLISPFFNQKLL